MHVFKHLEIQAIKEDRKRGVLTDSEYRRSYRHKTTAGQLNDFRSVLETQYILIVCQLAKYKVTNIGIPKNV